MQQSHAMPSAQESYAPTKWELFLWWLATAEIPLLKSSVSSRNRYSIIGMCVLSTWLFATLAWMYFFSTVINHVFAFIALGLLMGCIILTIDRALIKSISTNNRKKIFPLLFRGLLAITIGTFMAQPALLYLFNKEIMVQVSVDNEVKKKEKLTQQETAISTTKNQLLQQRNDLQKRLDEQYKETINARNTFIAETDGTGGSKKIGLKDIAKAKQDAYEKSNNAYQQLLIQIQPQLKSIDSNLNIIQNNIQKGQEQFSSLLNNGFLTQIEALNNLIKTNTALQFRYYLLIFILVLIELMPVLAKTFLPAGAYEEKVLLYEQNEIALLKQNFANKLQLQQQYNQLAFEADTDFTNNYFATAKKETNTKLQTAVTDWKTQSTTQKDLWNGLRDGLMME